MTKLLVINTFDGKVDWVNSLNFPYIIYRKFDPLIPIEYYKTSQENLQEYYKRLIEIPNYLELTKPKTDDPHIVINVGHESSTFWTHIINHFEDLADLTIFVHTNPFHHYHNGDFIEMLNNISEIQDFMDWGTEMKSDYRGQPTDVCPVSEIFHELYPDREVPEEYIFKAGSLFALSKDNIRRIGIDFFKQCLQIAVTKPLAPWAFERLFRTMFT